MPGLEGLPEFLTVEETASLLRLHPRTIRNRINAGLLPAKQIKGGKSRLIARADVLGLLEDVTPHPIQSASSADPAHNTVTHHGGEDKDTAQGSGEHLQKVQRALEDNPVEFQRWNPKSLLREDGKK